MPRISTWLIRKSTHEQDSRGIMAQIDFDGSLDFDAVSSGLAVCQYLIMRYLLLYVSVPYTRYFKRAGDVTLWFNSPVLYTNWTDPVKVQTFERFKSGLFPSNQIPSNIKTKMANRRR